MTDAPKIDTQAPRIGMTVGVDFATGKDTTMLTLTMGDKVEFASPDSLWGQAMLDLLAERDLADARAAAAAQAMREAAAKVAQGKHDAAAKWAAHYLKSFDGQTDSLLIAQEIHALPLPDPAALDRLIAERVREAVEAEREALRQAWTLMDHFAVVLHEADGRYVSVKQKHYEAARAAIAVRGSKDGRDG